MAQKSSLLVPPGTQQQWNYHGETSTGPNSLNPRYYSKISSRLSVTRIPMSVATILKRMHNGRWNSGRRVLDLGHSISIIHSFYLFDLSFFFYAFPLLNLIYRMSRSSSSAFSSPHLVYYHPSASTIINHLASMPKIRRRMYVCMLPRPLGHSQSSVNGAERPGRSRAWEFKTDITNQVAVAPPETTGDGQTHKPPWEFV